MDEIHEIQQPNSLEIPGADGADAPPASAPQTLFDYKRTELRTVTDLRRLRDIAARLGLNPAILELTDDVLRRVENKRFSIAVVGEFKRGKSTFINALLGREILPADIMPCSATLNRVTYGLKPAVSIYYKPAVDGHQRIDEIEIDQLQDYVTKLTPEAERNAAQIAEAVIYYPSDYCQNNVDIIDTPGLNDDATMTAVTLSVIPRVDAAILVIMPEAPFAGTEGDFLTNHLLLQDLGRVIFVVSAIDRLRRPEDRKRIVEVIEDRIVRAVETRLREQFQPGSEDYELYRQQIGKPTIFPLSAFQALEAQRTGNETLLAESRFPNFTSALEEFLTQTRGTIELQVLANRILATAEEVTKKINIELGALGMEHEQFEKAFESAQSQLEALRRRRQAELKKIDEAAMRSSQRLEIFVEQLEVDLEKTVAQLIAEATITAEEIRKENLKNLTNKLGKQISEAVNQSARRSGERIQIEIEKDLQTEVNRLQDFATTVGKTLHGIELQFSDVDASPSANRSAGGEGAAAAISAVTGLWAIWIGYREGGLKAASTAGFVSLGTTVASSVLAALIGIPLSWPLILGVTLVSLLTGSWAARVASSDDRIERFRENYKKSALEHLRQKIQEQRLQSRVTAGIGELYRGLKEKLVGELSSSIDQAQSTLDELRNKKAREETLSERKRQESEELRAEVQAIRTKALRLSSQLAEITNV